jgi:glycosyltransferase involved in cell wall biosynthesis
MTMKTCLCMIVKNSGEILRTTLRSFLPHVDHFVICDTGSTDQTPEILLQETELYSGFLFKAEFVDFSHNRNLVLERAEQQYPGCYYITIDDSYTLENPEGFHSFFETATDPAYLVFIRNEETQYLCVKISTTGMRYRYRIHEVLDPKEPPKIATDFLFQEHRPADHRTRTAERADFDIKCLRKDLEDHPKDPRLMFYIGRTLFNQQKWLEAAEWFKERVCLESGSRYERYQSMVYIALIAEKTHHPEKELVDLYLGIYNVFPEYKEPLYYAALAYSDMRQHDKSIELLEKAYYTPARPEFCSKHVIAQREIPRMLARYYFKTDLEKCVPFLFKHYIQAELEFDYIYESYLRHIFRFSPIVVYPAKWVIYSDNLPKETFQKVFAIEDSVVFDSRDEETYRKLVCNYSVRNLLVLNRVDRIAFFPNVENVFLMLLKDTPEGGMLDCFPALRAVIAKDSLHATRLQEDYLTGSGARLVITTEQFLLLVQSRE